MVVDLMRNSFEICQFRFKMSFFAIFFVCFKESSYICNIALLPPWGEANSKPKTSK